MISKQTYSWPGLFGCALSLTLTSHTFALEVQVRVACPSWNTEQVSQIEARIRAELLLEDLGARQVLIACQGEGVQVNVESTGGRLSRPVSLGQQSLQDSIVQAVDLALRELKEPAVVPPASAPAAAASETPKPAPPPAEVPKAARETPPAASIVPPRPPTSLEAALSVQGERWSSYNALGGSVGASTGTGRLRYGFEFGGLVALGEPSAFQVSEWHVGVRLGWSPPGFLGLRGNIGVGGSLLLTEPSRGLSVDSGTALSAAYAELGVSRPFWIGALGISPELGVRASSAERRVRVNDVEQLLLPVLAPVAKLSALWRQR